MKKKSFSILFCMFMFSWIMFNSNVNGMVFEDSSDPINLETV